MGAEGIIAWVHLKEKTMRRVSCQVCGIFLLRGAVLSAPAPRSKSDSGQKVRTHTLQNWFEDFRVGFVAS